MGRNRSTRRDSALPDYVYRIASRNRVVWREYLGNGKFGRSAALKDAAGQPLPASASHREILAAYNDQIARRPGRTLEWLLREHMQAPRVRPIAERTERDYRRYVEAICSAPMKNGGRFGDTDVKRLSPSVLAKYRDRLKATPVQANRHLQFLSAAFAWAIERELLATNPAAAVAKYSTGSRTRYVEDWEFDLVQGLAPDYVAVAMELAYLMRGRRGEILAIKREHVDDRGIYLKRSKASESEVTLWTDRLRDAHRAAQAINRGVISPWLLHGPDGEQINAESFSTAWTRVMARAMKKGLRERFTFHDLKAKGLTDHKHGWAGHKSDRMRSVYQRLAKEIEATR